MTDPRRQFASDNNAGICPEAWAAMAEANAGHAPVSVERIVPSLEDVFIHCIEAEEAGRRKAS